MPGEHIAGNLVIVVLFFLLGWILSRRPHGAVAGLVLSGLVGVLALLMILRADLFVSVVPYTHLLFYSNLFPFAAALFIPCVLAFARSRGQKIRMVILCCPLFGVSLIEYQRHFLPPARAGKTYIDENGICRQTSSDTCSAAAIVTLLRRHGIAITEAEAAETARTKRGHGTTNLGVYRALRLGTKDDADLHVSYRRMTAKELVERDEQAIVTVGLPKGGKGKKAQEYGNKWNWEPGVYHDVVFLGVVSKAPLKLGIADPDFGLEHWPAEDFEYLYQGFAFIIGSVEEGGPYRANEEWPG